MTSSQHAQQIASHTIQAGRPIELSTLESGLQQIQRDIVDLEKLLAQVHRAWSIDATDVPEQPNDSP
ncbi:MAG: hypothetical protein VX519_06880 [Myxococcota bacterium]|nr:hypothetical protein [Myxococcota bacterium]